MTELLKPPFGLTSAELIQNPQKYFDAVGLKELTPADMTQLATRARERITQRIYDRTSYPTFLKPIDPEKLEECEGQKNIVIEVGGTKMRASEWIVKNGKVVLNGNTIFNGQLVDEKGKEKKAFNDSDDFFDHLFTALPGLIDRIKGNPDAALSIIFSFPGQPTETEAGLDYEVGVLTKDFVIPEFEHTQFIPHLADYLKKKHQIEGTEMLSKVSLFNDTAILVGVDNNIGEVIGTGFNYALKITVKRLREMLGSNYAPGWDDNESMIVNIEAGNLGVMREFLGDENKLSFLNRISIGSSKPEEYREEKLISGMYLKEALKLVLEDINNITDNSAATINDIKAIESKHISMILKDNWNDVPFTIAEEYKLIVKRACEIIRNRSAQVAASLTQGGLMAAGEKHLATTIEGSVYWDMPGYGEEYAKAIHLMSGDNFSVSVNRPTIEGVGPELGSQYMGAVAGLLYFRDRGNREE